LFIIKNEKDGKARLLIWRANSTSAIPAEAGIQRYSKHAIVGSHWIPDQARNDEIHGIFWLDQ
jgi:hypothetical protein